MPRASFSLRRPRQQSLVIAGPATSLSELPQRRVTEYDRPMTGKSNEKSPDFSHTIDLRFARKPKTNGLQRINGERKNKRDKFQESKNPFSGSYVSEARFYTNLPFLLGIGTP